MKTIELIENARNDINTLMQLSDEEKSKLVSIDFKSLISDDDKCSKLVESIASSFELNQNKFKIMQRKDRASHSVITWLLGVGINKNIDILGNGYRNMNLLWLQTSVNHDYGYYLDEIRNKKNELNDITKKYDLFSDDYSNTGFDNLNSYLKGIRFSEYANFFTYNPEDIRNYYDYKKEWSILHEEDEINDHGIVGACKLFRLYCENAELLAKRGLLPSIIQMQIKKISCYNIASHNIFKSSCKKDDVLYKKHNLHVLTSDSNATVKKDNGLLMLLCLVDTIECYKRFSRKDNMGLNTRTILENTNISFEESRIFVDFEPLDNYIKDNKKDKLIREEMSNTLKKHVSSIYDLNKWTEYQTKRINDFKVQISF